MPSVSATSAARPASSGSMLGGIPGEVSISTRLSHTLGVGEDETTRHHAAHRVAEQRERPEPEVVGDGERVRDEPIERVAIGVGGLVAGAVPPMVEEDDPRVLGEPRHVVGEVLPGPGEPVHHEERRAAAELLDREADAVVGRDAHRVARLLQRAAGTSTGRSRARDP